MDISVAIDFGTSRTKVGWRDENNEIHIIDWNGSPYLPSVFHLPPECNDILLGEEALEALIEEPNGGIVNLKREIIENNAMPFTYKERQEGAELLVETMFRVIRDACFSQIPQLNDEFPENLTIATPAQMALPWRLLMEKGAQSIGVAQPVIALPEPVAAARHWFSEQAKSEGTLLVLDCGGGTTDLALVKRSQEGKLSLSTEFRPQSLSLGGSDVDKALFRYLLQHHEDIVKKQAVQRLLLKVRHYKETVLGGQTRKPFRVGGRATNLDNKIVSTIYQQAFIDPLLQEIGSTLEKITDKHPESELVLVGGGSEASALKAALTSMTSFPVHKGKEVGLSVLQGCLCNSQSRLAGSAGTNDKKESAKSQVPEKWYTPDVHSWNTQQVQQWQAEVAEQLGEPITKQWPLKDGTWGPNMVLIPSGRYLMGSPTDDARREDREGPQHQVTISKPFYLGQTALTFKDYDHYCEVTGVEKPEDSGWGRGSRPVINVSWEDAERYCQWLSEQTGMRFQLPTEGQWEYACRAGTTTAFWWGSTLSTDRANYKGDFPYNGGNKGVYREKTLTARELEANPWGLYQMHGNVWEWCEDWFGGYKAGVIEDPSGATSSANRVLRGGSWCHYGRYLRSTYRYLDAPGRRDRYYGFRLSCGSIEPSQ